MASCSLSLFVTTQVEAFKKSLKDAVGKKMWKIYNNIKSELVNHWLPHFKVQNGEDVDDAVERVWMHGHTKQTET